MFGSPVRFADFVLDLRAGELRKSGIRLRVPDQSIQVLTVLLEKPGEVITREELYRRLWPDGTTVEFEQGLNAAVKRLRGALLDSASQPKYIETLPKRGYRFVFPLDIAGAQKTNGVILQKRAASWPRLTVIALIVTTTVAGVVLWIGKVRSTSVEASLTTISPLTSYPGVEIDPAFSPDGNYLAFAWDGGKGGSLDIYVKTIPDGDPIRLTTDPGDKRNPVWSPDGREIAFVRNSQKNGGVFVLPALGGAERRVADCPESGRARYAEARSLILSSLTKLAWIPDPSSLAYSRKDPESGRNAIYTALVESGQQLRLTSPEISSGDNFPAVSPDGRRLAFIRTHDDGDDEIRVLPVKGGESRPLIADLHDTQWLTWTRDGKDLIVFTRRERKAFAWWRVSLSGAIPRLETALRSNAFAPSLSPKRNQLAYAESSQDTNIWTLQLSEPGGAPFSKLIASTREDHSPDFSPDGTMIAFVSNRTGYDNIWVCARDGQRARQITTFRGVSVGTPRWSPDGTRIAFDSTILGKANVFIIGRDGGQFRRVTHDSASERVPSWSHDGGWIYFRSLRNGADQIWKMPVDGGPAVQVTHHGGLDAFESPDGKFLYFTKDRGPGGIWRIPVNGGAEQPVPELSNAGYWRYWAVLSKGLYFVSHEGSPRYPLKRFDFSSGRVTELAVLEREPLWWVPGLSISPDGRVLLYTQVDSVGSDIMMLDNFR